MAANYGSRQQPGRQKEAAKSVIIHIITHFSRWQTNFNQFLTPFDSYFVEFVAVQNGDGDNSHPILDPAPSPIIE